jgi:sulfhydrogenase subunit beta (sulfur reductase)
MESSPQIYELASSRGLDSLIDALKVSGFDVIGPRRGDGVIDLGPIESSQDLPWGLADTQEKGQYRLISSNNQTFFGFNLGPRSWKSFLFPERRKLWSMAKGMNPVPAQIDPATYRPFAFFGVRACELAAIRIQDRILRGSDKDPEYTARREALLIVGVHCQTAAATCFCPSMGTGPEFPQDGWDILLTELPHTFFVQSGSGRGAEILSRLELKEASSDAGNSIQNLLDRTRSQIKRSMPQDHIREDIYSSLKSRHWEDVGERCLACANCTMVCPTCFCTTLIDTLDITGTQAERTHTWDSCFHLDFSYLHGGSHRVSNASRYRQWFSHKLASWIDQFGSSGCVGCGRCVTWCPVGIDITEEMATLRLKASNKEGSDDS